MMPLTSDTPKCLLEVGGKTILERQVENLYDIGISENDIIVVTGYMNEKIEKFLEDSNVKTIENQEWDETDNLYTFLLTEQKCKEEDMIVLNGDVVFDSKILERATSNQGSCYPIDRDIEDEESLKVETSGKQLMNILPKKSENYDGATTEIFFISGKHTKELYRKSQEITDKDKTQWFDNGVDKIVPTANFTTVDVSDLFWREVDTPEELEDLEKELSKRGI